jgi:hypothetical protein
MSWRIRFRFIQNRKRLSRLHIDGGQAEELAEELAS